MLSQSFMFCYLVGIHTPTENVNTASCGHNDHTHSSVSGKSKYDLCCC